MRGCFGGAGRRVGRGCRPESVGASLTGGQTGSQQHGACGVKLRMKLGMLISSWQHKGECPASTGDSRLPLD